MDGRWICEMPMRHNGLSERERVLRLVDNKRQRRVVVRGEERWRLRDEEGGERTGE